MADLPPDPVPLPFRDRNGREPRREPWHPPLRRPRRRYPPLDDLDDDISFTFEFCYNQALSGVSTVLLFVAVYKWLLIEEPDDSLLPRTRRPRRRRDNTGSQDQRRRSRSRSPIKAKLTNADIRMELRLTIGAPRIAHTIDDLSDLLLCATAIKPLSCAVKTLYSVMHIKVKTARTTHRKCA